MLTQSIEAVNQKTRAETFQAVVGTVYSSCGRCCIFSWSGVSLRILFLVSLPSVAPSAFFGCRRQICPALGKQRGRCCRSDCEESSTKPANKEGATGVRSTGVSQHRRVGVTVRTWSRQTFVCRLPFLKRLPFVCRVRVTVRTGACKRLSAVCRFSNVCRLFAE